MIAFEMAHQLPAHGHEVALLALFEPTNPGAEKPKLPPMPLPQRVFRYLKAISALDPGDKLAYVLQGMKQRSRRVRQAAEIGVKDRLCNILLALGQPLPLRLRTFHRRRHLYSRLYPAAARTYKPRAYPGRVVLFRVGGSQPSSRSSWAELAVGGLETYEVPGDHYSILAEPNVSALAAHLKACLEKTHTLISGGQTRD